MIRDAAAKPRLKRQGLDYLSGRAPNQPANPMADNRHSMCPDWRLKLQAAQLETDPMKVRQRFFSLEDALVSRMEFLADTPDAEELLAIRDGLRWLRFLQIKKLNYPDWKKKN